MTEHSNIHTQLSLTELFLKAPMHQDSTTPKEGNKMFTNLPSVEIDYITPEEGRGVRDTKE